MSGSWLAICDPAHTALGALRLGRRLSSPALPPGRLLLQMAVRRGQGGFPVPWFTASARAWESQAGSCPAAWHLRPSYFSRQLPLGWVGGAHGSLDGLLHPQQGGLTWGPWVGGCQGWTLRGSPSRVSEQWWEGAGQAASPRHGLAGSLQATLSPGLLTPAPGLGVCLDCPLCQLAGAWEPLCPT